MNTFELMRPRTFFQEFEVSVKSHWKTLDQPSQRCTDSDIEPVNTMSCIEDYIERTVGCYGSTCYRQVLAVRNPTLITPDAADFLEVFYSFSTVRVDSLPHRKWKETKQQPGTAGPGNMLDCCLVSFHFLWVNLSTSTVNVGATNLG